MSNITKLFGTDKSLECKGIVLDYGDVKVTIARAGGANKRYTKTLERISRPVRRAIQTETLGDKASDAILYRTYAESVVLGWEGVKDDDGKDIPYSVDACIAFFEAAPDFFTEIRTQADKASLFRAVDLERDAKN